MRTALGQSTLVNAGGLRSLLNGLVDGCQFVQSLGSKVSAVRPDDCSTNMIDGHQRKVAWIAKWCKDRTTQQRTHVHDLSRAVVENKVQEVRPTYLCFENSQDHRFSSVHSNGAMRFRASPARARSQFRSNSAR